jgi:prepilin-type N-terminal cleavage/methylation domain-containing protein
MKKGFTLIELLVSIGIFIVVTGMVVANFRAGSRSDELKITADALVSNLRRAQNMSLAGELVNGVTPPGGYGVYFNLGTPNRYVIFADSNGNLVYDANEDLSDGLIVLPKDIVINTVSPKNISSVVFKPPKPTIYINGDPPSDTLVVTLKHNVTGKSKKIIVNRISGRIDIE